MTANIPTGAAQRAAAAGITSDVVVGQDMPGPEHIAPMVAHLLIVGLVLSCLVEYGVTAVSYWRDRR